MCRTTPFTTVLIGLGMLAAGLSPAGSQTNAPGDEIQQLRARNQSLAKEYELATGTSFYLLIDPVTSQLVLAYRGTELHRYAVLDARVGVPRIAFVRGNARGDPAAVTWSEGRLDPQRPSDRIEVKVGSEDEPEPQPPEVAIPVPAVYRLRFQGLVLEIQRSGDSPSGWKGLLAGWRARGHEVLAAFSPIERGLVHVRLVLSPGDADSLYRSVPPDTRLLIVAPGTHPGGAVAPHAGNHSPQRSS